MNSNKATNFPHSSRYIFAKFDFNNNMNFLLSLGKDTLNSIRSDLINLKPQDPNLNSVTLDEFCFVLLDHLSDNDDKIASNGGYFSSKEFLSLVRCLCTFFDAVDVDSRGMISFLDFTNLCLRVGRLQFKPSIKKTISNYAQDISLLNYQYSITKLCFIGQTQLLFSFESEVPMVRAFRKGGKEFGKWNPVTDLKRLIGIKIASCASYSDKKAMAKEIHRMKMADKLLNPQKGKVLAMAYVDSTRQYVFSVFASFLIFTESYLRDDEDLSIIDFVHTEEPQYGILYSRALNLILTWSGEGSSHQFYVWDPHTRELKMKIKRHAYKILSVCEVIIDPFHPLSVHYFASASIDKKVILWTSMPIAIITHKTSKLMRATEPQFFELKGHSHTIRSLVFAPEHELLIGAGFDYEIFAWDPLTKDIVMRFIGHFCSISSLHVVYTPNEKVVSLDEGGVYKVWNIDKELGLFAEQVQSMQLQCAQPITLYDAAAAFSGGSTLAFLADKLYYSSIEPEVVDALRPVVNGIGFCENSNRLWIISRDSIHLAQLSDGQMVKRLAFLDQDRNCCEDMIAYKSDVRAAVTTTASATISSAVSLGEAGRSSRNATTIKSAMDGQHAAHSSLSHMSNFIDQKDTATAMATDPFGKKVFLGTSDGRVLLFDSFTFGLLLQLTNDEDDVGFRTQGFVAGLYYVARDELLVAAYSNGAVKLFVGCHRANPSLHEKKHHAHDDSNESTKKHKEYPSGGGGKPPTKPYLLRESDLGIITDNSVNGLAVSAEFGLIAICTKDSFIYVHDYISMELLSVLRIPRFEDKSVQCIGIQFTPEAPMLLAVDSVGRVTAWTVNPLRFRWIHSWSVYHSVDYGEGDVYGWSNRKTISDVAKYTSEPAMPVSGLQLTTIKCVYQNEGSLAPPPPPDGESISELVTQKNISQGESYLSAKGSGSRGLPSPKVSSTAQGFSSSWSESSPARGAVRPANRTVRKKPSARIWTVLLGDEGGNVMFQNISRLVEKSGAGKVSAKTGTSQPVYQRLKPMHPGHGHGHLPGKKSTSDLGSSAGGSKALSQSIISMCANPIGTHERVPLNSPILTYVVGVRKWIAFHGDPIRVISPVDARVFNQYAENLPVEAKDPSFVAKPEMLLTVNDMGAVKLWSWDGRFLGNMKEESVNTKSIPMSDIPINIIGILGDTQKPPEPEEDPDKDLLTTDLADLYKATIESTFITSVIVDVNPAAAAAAAAAALVPKKELNLMTDKLKDENDGLSIIPKTPAAAPSPARRVSLIRKLSFAGPSAGSSESLRTHKRDVLSTSDYNNQIVSRHIDLVEVAMNHRGWQFPHVCIKSYDALANEDTVISYTEHQFQYYRSILNWLFPYINRHIDNMLLKLQQSQARRPFQKVAFTYSNSYKSTEELLMGLNSFFVSKRAQSPPKLGAIGHVSSASISIATAGPLSTVNSGTHAGVPTDGQYLNSLDKIDVSDDRAKASFTRQHNRKNMSDLIEYIQGSAYFDSELKTSASSSLRFNNFEKEQTRNMFKNKDEKMLQEAQAMHEQRVKEAAAAAAAKQAARAPLNRQDSGLDVVPIEHDDFLRQFDSPKRVTFGAAGNNNNDNEQRPGSPAAAAGETRDDINVTPNKAKGMSALARLSMTRPKSAMVNGSGKLSPTSQRYKDVKAKVNSTRDFVVGKPPAPAQVYLWNMALEPEVKEVPETHLKINSILHSLRDIDQVGKPPVKPPLERKLSKGIGSSQNLLARTVSGDLSSDGEGSKRPATRDESRYREIEEKFEKNVQEGAGGGLKLEKYRQFLKNKLAKPTKRKVLGEFLTNEDFEGVVDVELQLKKEEIKRAKSNYSNIHTEASRGPYGPYNIRDIYAYINLLSQLGEGLSKEEVEEMGEFNRFYLSGLGHDSMNPYEGQTKYDLALLLENPVLLRTSLLYTSVFSFSERFEFKIIAERELIDILFSFAKDAEKIRIYLFVRIARMTYALMQSAIQFKEAKLTTMQLHNIAKDQHSTSKLAASLQHSVKLDSTLNAAGSSNNLVDLDPDSAIPTTKRLNVNIGSRFVVRPHPRRGFRNWVVKRRDVSRITRILDRWQDTHFDALTIQEFIDIMQSMVPLSELDNYRVLRSLSMLINKLEYKPSMELTGDVYGKLIEYVLEMRIISE